MKLIVYENITFAKEAFSSLGNSKLVEGRTLTNKDVQDADVLVVRSITNVNEDLLKNSNVKFVGTATIGTDHIDLDYLGKHDIQFADAKGCNADSVAEYVFTALLKVATVKNISLQEKTIGVVGVGNIGSKIVRLAESLKMEVLKNDPPLERKGIGKNFVSLEAILKADIITLHVPMSYEGVDKTFHLLNENNLKQLKEGSILINSSRGAVIDNSALLNEYTKKEFELILDVWENEPQINNELLKVTKIATPHIAGYSLEGKVNGTKMIYNALCQYLKIQPSWQPILPEIEHKRLRFPEGKTDGEKLYNLFSSIYNIEKDDELMRKIEVIKPNEQASYFDFLRKKYPVRREFSNYVVQISENEIHLKPFLENCRFTVEIV
jgi:erythronate-4-phosphate dehydrogenase